MFLAVTDETGGIALGMVDLDVISCPRRRLIFLLSLPRVGSLPETSTVLAGFSNMPALAVPPNNGTWDFAPHRWLCLRGSHNLS